jgi:hypothetical protein
LRESRASDPKVGTDFGATLGSGVIARSAATKQSR